MQEYRMVNQNQSFLVAIFLSTIVNGGIIHTFIILFFFLWNATYKVKLSFSIIWKTFGMPYSCLGVHRTYTCRCRYFAVSLYMFMYMYQYDILYNDFELIAPNLHLQMLDICHACTGVTKQWNIRTLLKCHHECHIFTYSSLKPLALSITLYRYVNVKYVSRFSFLYYTRVIKKRRL